MLKSLYEMVNLKNSEILLLAHKTTSILPAVVIFDTYQKGYCIITKCLKLDMLET